MLISGTMTTSNSTRSLQFQFNFRRNSHRNRRRCCYSYISCKNFRPTVVLFLVQVVLLLFVLHPKVVVNVSAISSDGNATTANNDVGNDDGSRNLNSLRHDVQSKQRKLLRTPFQLLQDSSQTLFIEEAVPPAEPAAKCIGVSNEKALLDAILAVPAFTIITTRINICKDIRLSVLREPTYNFNGPTKFDLSYKKIAFTCGKKADSNSTKEATCTINGNFGNYRIFYGYMSKLISKDINYINCGIRDSDKRNDIMAGGAMYFVQSNVTLRDNTAFQNNKATIQGGAIYMETSQLILSSSQTKATAISFSNNFSGNRGGAISAVQSNIISSVSTSSNVRTVVFRNNRATQYSGGAISFNTIASYYNPNTDSFFQQKSSLTGILFDKNAAQYVRIYDIFEKIKSIDKKGIQ